MIDRQTKTSDCKRVSVCFSKTLLATFQFSARGNDFEKIFRLKFHTWVSKSIREEHFLFTTTRVGLPSFPRKHFIKINIKPPENHKYIYIYICLNREIANQIHQLKLTSSFVTMRERRRKKNKQTKHTFPNQFVESIFCLAPHELGCFHFLESSLSNQHKAT